ncbi:MAG: TonB family protein [Mariprofundaceae bacterium]|nr:TonB family protein [Mariprofundaceae bacterium]
MQEPAQVFKTSVRWMAAMMAAIALHGLLFVVLIPKTPPSKYKPPFEVRLLDVRLFKQELPVLPPARKAVTLPLKKTIKQQRPVQQAKPQVPVAKALPIKSTPKKIPPVIHGHSKIAALLSTPSQSSKHSTTQPAPVASPITSTSKPTKNHVSVVSKGVQLNILAAVHYPKQARRHGWQGTVEFQFDVQHHVIQGITLLKSSKRSVLDRAAKRGLQAMDFIDLPDGRYRMPVVFRLQ